MPEPRSAYYFERFMLPHSHLEKLTIEIALPADPPLTIK